MRTRIQQLAHNRTVYYGLLVLLLLGLVVVHTAHFHGRNYRQDETWDVHLAMELIRQDGLAAHVLGMFTELDPTNFLHDIWVYAFGHVEPVTRYMATLYVFLTLAIVYRIGADLFDRRTGILAVLLVGTLNFFTYYAHENRVYAPLVFNAACFSWAMLRYIHTQERKYLLIMGVVGSIGIYQHFFISYVIAANALLYLIFARWDVRRMAPVIITFAVIGLVALPRFIVVINSTNYTGGLIYALDTTWDDIRIILDQIALRPEALLYFLLLSAVFLPNWRDDKGKEQRVRWHTQWQKWHLLGLLLVMVVLALGINLLVQNLTPRNMIILVPVAGVVFAMALRQLPWQAQATTLILLVVPFLTNFQPLMGNAGYRELGAYIQDVVDPVNDQVVVMAEELWEHVPIKYFLQERTGFNWDNTVSIHVATGPHTHLNSIPSPPTKLVWSPQDTAEAELLGYLTAERVWLINGNILGNSQSDYDDLLAALAEVYVPTTNIDFPGETYYYPLGVTQYRRIPDGIGSTAQYGEEMVLGQWTLLDDVNRRQCDTITIESWWQAPQGATANYNLTLVLAGQDGNGVAQSDGSPGDSLTKLWQADTWHLDTRTLMIPCDLEAGSYNLLLGVYDAETLTPQALADGNPLQYLTTLEVAFRITP